MRRKGENSPRKSQQGGGGMGGREKFKKDQEKGREKR